MSGTTSPLVHNEQVKLLAAALDRASTAFLTVGIAAPLAGSLLGGVQPGGGLWTAAALAGASIFAAAVLHLIARSVLGVLRP